MPDQDRQGQYDTEKHNSVTTHMITQRILINKGTLLKPETQAQRLTTVPAPGEDCEEYGLGIMFKTNPPMWGHTGTIPGYKNWAGYSPSENITIVISYNAIFAKPMDLAVRLMNIYLKATKP